jgi:DNA-binding transcriptional LysR family regulator
MMLKLINYCKIRNNHRTMDRFHAISVFARVVEMGSFARAAERLDVSVSAVSRAVADLEAHLQTRLLNRTTRRLSLTESGRAFHERTVQLLADLEEAEQSAQAGAVTPRGTLRLTCAVTFGTRHVAAAIADFVARYPETRFDIELSDRAVDLVDEGFDVAVRIGQIGSQNLVGRKVGTTQLVCCAAPTYLDAHGEPRTPEALAAHTCLTYEYAPTRNVWTFRDGDGRDRSVRIGGPVHANNGRFLEALAVAGTGVCHEPDFIVGPDVRAGRLRPILREFAPPASPIYVVYPSRRHLSAKVRAFTDFIAERFAGADWRLAAAPSPGAPPRKAARRAR